MRTFILVFAASAALSLPAQSAETTVTIMSFNIWGAGANNDKPIDETVAAIKAVNPDIIGLQETRAESDPCDDVCPPTGESRAKAIAEALGYNYYDQTAQNDALWANAILSKFPIGRATPNDLGVTIDVNGRKVNVFNIHLDDSPYQPYQLLGIEYGPFPFIKTEAEAVKFAEETRGPALKKLFDDMAAAGEADASFVFGDFNEPSHLDWTEAAVKAGNQPLPVAFPSTLSIEKKGFVDTFRMKFPDPAAKPGFTWTPTSEPTDKEDHHDRIDFALAKGANLKVLDAGIVGEKSPQADIVVTPWPADHRSTFAKVSF